jgi:hypothetical protein
MRKLLLFLLILSLLPLSSRAQITSLNVEIKPFGHGWKQVVENHGSSSIVAMHSPFQCEVQTRRGSITSTIVYTYDFLTGYGTSRDIPPGGVERFDAPDPSTWSGGVDAVIFSDGHSEGDPKGVSALYQRRQGFYNGIIEALQLLDTIANQGANPAEVADSVHLRSESLAKHGTKANDEWVGLTELYSGLESLLRAQKLRWVPSDSTPYPQPTIEEVAKVNGIPRQQAHAIALSKRYDELKADLEGNLEPPAGK